MPHNEFVARSWNLAEEDGRIGTWEKVQIAVLMDIRSELVRLNRLLSCPNFVTIPHTLNQIQRNTAKPKSARARKSA